MTTAHRPTWDPARATGGTARDKGNTGSYSVRDLPGHTHLKERTEGIYM